MNDSDVSYHSRQLGKKRKKKVMLELSSLRSDSMSDFTKWCQNYRHPKSTYEIEAYKVKGSFSSVQFSGSVMSDSLWPHESQHTRPPYPLLQLLEFTQTHVHQVGDAIQPSHPLLSPSPPAPNPSQHQGLFQWVTSLHEVAKVLEFQLQHQSFQWTPRTDLLQDGLVGSPCSPRDFRESSPTPQFKSINSPALSFPHSPTLTSIHDHWKNHSLDQMDLCW